MKNLWAAWKQRKKNDINYVVKGNALKQKSAGKKAEIKSYWYFRRNGRSCNCSLLTFPLMHVFFIRDLARNLVLSASYFRPKSFKCLRVFLNINSIYFKHYSSKTIKVLNRVELDDSITNFHWNVFLDSNKNYFSVWRTLWKRQFLMSQTYCL